MGFQIKDKGHNVFPSKHDKVTGDGVGAPLARQVEVWPRLELHKRLAVACDVPWKSKESIEQREAEAEKTITTSNHQPALGS